MSKRQVINFAKYDVSNMVFSEPKVEKIPGSSMSGRRVQIQTKNKDGSVGPLIVKTENLFSLGVTTNTSMDSGKVTGYSLALCLRDNENPTPEEERWVSVYEQLVEKCKDYILEIAADIGNAELERAELKKFGALSYRKDERGVPDKTTSPWMYPKLLVKKSSGELDIRTRFYDQNTSETIPVETLLTKPKCMTRAALKFESIYIGARISLQVKVMEAQVALVESTASRLLSPVGENRPQLNLDESDSESEEDGVKVEIPADASDDESSEMDEEPPAPKKAARGRKAASKK